MGKGYYGKPGSTASLRFKDGKWQVAGKNEGFSARFGAVMLGTTALVQTIQSICNMISQSYQLMIRMKEAEMEMVEMQMCLELYQHMLDTGMCEGREQSCFQGIQSCIKWGEVRGVMNDVNTYMNNINSEMNKIDRAWAKAGKAWDKAWPTTPGAAGAYGKANLQVTCGGNPGSCCNAFVKSRSDFGNPVCGYNKLEIKVMKITGCNFPVVRMSTDGTNYNMEPITGTTSHTIELQTLTQPTKYYFKLYCFENGEDYASTNMEEATPATAMPYTFEVSVDRNNDCDCQDSGEYLSVPSPSGTSSSAIGCCEQTPGATCVNSTRTECENAGATFYADKTCSGGVRCV